MSTELKKQPSPQTSLSNFLTSLKSQIELALPAHMNADRMCRLALTAFSTTPKLQACDFRSIAACVMTASQLGLEIGVNGHCYMIPYGQTATLVPGWKGLVELVNRAGKASVWTGAVFEGDQFDWALGDRPFVTHRPNGESSPDKLLFAYAVGRRNGSDFPVIECWTNERLKAHFEKQNKVGKLHYAHQHWEMYARKIVLLQVLKYMPQSVELSKAVEAVYSSENMTVSGSVVSQPMVISNLDALTDRLNGTTEQEPAGSTTAADTTEKQTVDETAKQVDSEPVDFTEAIASFLETAKAEVDSIDGIVEMSKAIQLRINELPQKGWTAESAAEVQSQLENIKYIRAEEIRAERRK